MNSPEKIQIEKTRLLIADEIQTIFLPKGYIAGIWNKALVCSSDSQEPILGWIYSDITGQTGQAKWFLNLP